jgi:Domain of unknown function (DUF5642)
MFSVVSTGVRRFWFICGLATLCVVTACGQPATSPETPPTGTSPAEAQVDPAKISRVRGDMPAGYEVADISGPASPVAFWGFGPGWVTDPPGCGVLAGPAADGDTTRGWSGSGPGGIVHAVVIGSPTAPVTFDQAVLAECGQWTVTSGNTSGTVNLVEAPAIDAADTVGMSTVATTVVEGGTSITSKASTFSAYLGDYLAFVTVVTDPGSPNPPLGQEFAAELLVKTVSALRG